MVNLSTSFIAGDDIDGQILVEKLLDLPIDGVELEYRISHQMFAQMRLPLKQSCLKVVSIHNYFPIPALKPPVKGGGDLFLLSSPDPEERQRAVNWTFRTIEHANDLEAPVAILHCGRVEFPAELERLYRFYNNERIDASEAQAFIQHKLNARDQVMPNHTDALLFSVDRLIPYAEKQGVTLGLENRYHYHELPTLPVMQTLLAEFKGGPIGYWHDTGHAHANEVLGLVEPGELLREFGTRIVGMHWHDAIGLKDHLPPGQGEIDFNTLEPYLHHDRPIVVELKPGTSLAQAQEGIEFTRKQLLLAAQKSQKPESLKT
jgi:sugar phosphate isomerase/epimerase